MTASVEHSTAVAGVSAASALPAMAGIHLPNAGTGHSSAPATSIFFLLTVGAVSALAGLVAFSLGRRREFEDDGIRA